jgi:hypothetical protein
MSENIAVVQPESYKFERLEGTRVLLTFWFRCPECNELHERREDTTLPVNFNEPYYSLGCCPPVKVRLPIKLEAR